MPPHAPRRTRGWLPSSPPRLVLALVVASVAPACKENAPALAPAPPPPAAAPAPLPAPPAPPAPPPSALRPALRAGAHVDGFRALAADDFRLIEDQGKRPAKIAVKLPRDRVDAKTFEQKIKARLPHEPDPAGGEGEDFRCDDAQRTCVFNDESGRATTYLFTAATPGAADQPKLREIQVGPAPR